MTTRRGKGSLTESILLSIAFWQQISMCKVHFYSNMFANVNDDCKTCKKQTIPWLQHQNTWIDLKNPQSSTSSEGNMATTQTQNPNTKFDPFGPSQTQKYTKIKQITQIPEEQQNGIRVKTLTRKETRKSRGLVWNSRNYEKEVQVQWDSQSMSNRAFFVSSSDLVINWPREMKFNESCNCESRGLSN